MIAVEAVDRGRKVDVNVTMVICLDAAVKSKLRKCKKSTPFSFTCSGIEDRRVKKTVNLILIPQPQTLDCI